MDRKAFFLVTLAIIGSLSTFRVPTAAAQQSESYGLGLQGIGARIGFVDPEGASSTVLLGVHIDAGQFVRNVHIIPHVEYWNVGVAGTDISDLTVATDVDVDFPLEGGRLIPYAGAGLGLHFLKADLPPGALGDDSRTKLGLNIQGGIKNQVMPNLGIFGEVKFAFVESADQLKIMGGFTYNFIY